MIKTPRFLFFFALTVSLSVVIINRQAILAANPLSLREGITVATADDPSYLAPVENFLLGKGWRDNSVGNAALTSRSPGYGIIYLLFRSFLHSKAALVALVALQVLLFAWAVARIPQIGENLGIRPNAARFFAIAVAAMPMFFGFLGYTLTEGLTPSLSLIAIYYLFSWLNGNKGHFNKRHFYGWIIAIALLVIIRPPMLIWLGAGLPLIFYSIPFFKRYLLGTFIAVLPLLVWLVYASSVLANWSGLHAIYHNDSPGLYRPLHGDIWDFHKMWGQTGHDFHRSIESIWSAALSGKDLDSLASKTVERFPPEVIAAIGQDRLEDAYTSYGRVLRGQASAFRANRTLEGETPLEHQLKSDFMSFKAIYQNKHPFEAYIFVPLKVYGQLAFHSNLSMYVFQKSGRGLYVVEALRYLSFFLHSSIFLLFPIAFVASFKKSKILVLALPIAVYLFYLCFVQRGIEERYTLPVLIPMALVVVLFLQRLAEKALLMARTNKTS